MPAENRFFGEISAEKTDFLFPAYNMYSCAISGMSREMMKITAEIEPNVKTGK